MMRAAFLIFLAACSSLDDIEPDVCGNGVLEAGEDCDSKDARCVQCGIRCEFAVGGAADEQCATFPGAAGFVCGADDFCHAPSGLFHPPTEVSTAIETFRSSDIDSDGFGDLIVQSSTSIRLLFGNADGHPTTSTQALTPIARGVAHYADLDLDPAKKLDILLPAADGIVAYTSPYDVLSPYPFPSVVSTASEGTPYYSNTIDEQRIGFVGTGPNAPAGSPLFYFVRDVGPMGGNMFVGMGPLCGATEQTFDAHAVDVYHVRSDYFLFATTFRQGTTLKLCVLGVAKSGTTYSVTEIPVNLGIGRTPASRPVLAPIGAGACPSIIIREQVGAAMPTDVVAFAGVGTTTCSYSVPSPRLLASDRGPPVGWAPLQPPDPSGATIALALASGVFAVPATGPLAQIYLADRALSSIVSADIDDDGDVDIIASSATAGEQVEDIDVLARVAQGFLRVRVDTEGPVDLLTIGDYDGNKIDDVAYVQTRVIGGVERYELVIAYATRDQLLPGVSAGMYGKIISLITGTIPDSNDPFNVITDLVVLYEDFQQSAITILHGSPQRTMLGFFDPRESLLPSVFYGVVAGQFNDAAGPPGLDMIAIEDGEAGVPRVWRSNGPTGGQVAGAMSNTVSLLADCDKSASATSLCIDSAVFVAWPKDPTHDRVIALGQDRNGDARVITFDPHVSTTAFPATAWPALPELAGKTRIRGAEVISVGGGRVLAVATFTQLELKIVVCAVGADGIASACHDLGAHVSAALGTAYSCTHATAARVRPVHRFMADATVERDLVAICHDKGNADATRLFRIALSDGAPGEVTELLRVPKAREVRIGDLDGNGLDDLLTVDRDSAVPTLRISRQCTSREVTTCGR